MTAALALHAKVHAGAGNLPQVTAAGRSLAHKKRIMVVFHDICQNHLHIQHQAPKSLNINTKLVVVEVAPPHFRPTPKTSWRF